MYLGRVSGPYHASLVSPIVGAARAALDEYEEIVTTKVSPFPFQARAHHYDVQRPFGQALAMTDAAQAILFAGLEKYMALCRRWEHDGTPLSVEDSLRVWGMIQQAGKLAREAVELLFHAASSGAAQKGPEAPALLPQDSNVSRTHLVAVPEHGFGHRASSLRIAGYRPVWALIRALTLLAERSAALRYKPRASILSDTPAAL